MRGRDIKRYKAEFADLWLINTHNGYTNNKGKRVPRIDVDNYPKIKEHLNHYWDKLKKRQDKGKTPYNLRNCAYYEEFEKEKIVYREISENMNASFIKINVFINNKLYMITGEHLIYLIAIINSTVFNKIILPKANTTGGKGVDFLENILIPKISASQQKPFEILVDKIISKKEAGEVTTAEEREIDIMVYKLYELTYDEVKIVDPEFALTKKEYENYE